MSFSDINFMRRALELAQNAIPHCPPNPAVGCVLVKERQIIGEGWTQKTGEAHAEIMALRNAQERGNDPKGAVAYVTLEPCSHFGRTPPCANALVEAGIVRVVVACLDPNPLVAGKGLQILRGAGVEVVSEVLASEAEEINIGFMTRMRTGRPWVRTKMAMSLDGRTALASGESKWITSQLSRDDGQRWRARAGAILTGLGTVVADNPRMNVRLPDVTRQPLKVIVDSMLRSDPEADIFKEGKSLLVCACADPVRQETFEAMGVEVLELPGVGGKVNLEALIEELGRREINELHVEAGARLNGSLVSLNLINEYLIYTAPLLLGEGKGLVNLSNVYKLADAPRLKFHSVERIGDDIRLQLRK